MDLLKAVEEIDSIKQEIDRFITELNREIGED
jgi:hypothetical protein